VLDVDNEGRGLVPGPSSTSSNRGEQTMKIRYIQNCKATGGKNAKIGDVLEIPDHIAKEAIGMGRAVAYVQPPPAPEKGKGEGKEHKKGG